MKDRVCEALQFAIDHYDNVGIGYDGSYFFPPMEMLSLLNSMAMAEKGQNLLIAGILYNVVEDTDATINMVWEDFGGEVAHLVGETVGSVAAGTIETPDVTNTSEGIGIILAVFYIIRYDLL